jgi:hypothetical protein
MLIFTKSPFLPASTALPAPVGSLPLWLDGSWDGGLEDDEARFRRNARTGGHPTTGAAAAGLQNSGDLEEDGAP